MENQGGPNSPWVRVVLAGAAAFIAVVVAFAVIQLTGDDSEPETSSTEPVAQSDIRESQSAEPEKNQKGQSSKPSEKKGGNGNPAGGSGDKGTSSGKKQTAKKGNGPCPAGMDRDICRSILESNLDAEGNPGVSLKKGECPESLGLSKEICRSIVKSNIAAKKNPEASTPAKNGECPPNMSEEICRSIVESDPGAPG